MSTYRKHQCRCGQWVTNNALGRAAHERACPGAPAPTMRLQPRQDALPSGLKRIDFKAVDK